MTVINYGKKYEIYPDDLKTHSELPLGTYKVNFNSMAGFSLSKIDDFEQKEPKIYGSHMKKIDKVLRSYGAMNRSLGIILSGDKGVGKSIFVQLLAERVAEEHMPVIVVKRAYPGIADFIESIDQEVLVMFDEFEKMFDQDDTESQDALLGLLDGVSQKKKMYVITVNNIFRVNEYMLNRPGRFHYHIRFGYLNSEDITEYLQDKIPSEYYGEIENVIRFGSKVPLNYDCLRAIAFELSFGISFADAIGDLNIINIGEQVYSVEISVLDKNGIVLEKLIEKREHLELFSSSCQIDFYGEDITSIDVTFDPKDIVIKGDYMVVPSELLTVRRGRIGENNFDDYQFSDLIIRNNHGDKLAYNAI